VNRAALRTLRRQPGYGTFLAGATMARTADEMFSVGVVLLILGRTGSATLAGATVAALTLPSVVSGPLLGAWLDVTGRRRSAMIVDQLLAASMLIALVLVAGHGPGLLLPLIALVGGFTWPLSFGGFTSLIPVLVPDELLTEANAVEATSLNMAAIVGPALAGIAVALGDPANALYLEAALTVLALAFIVRIPDIEGGGERPDETSTLAVARAGLRKLVSVPQLRGVTVAGMIDLAGIGLLTVAFPLFAFESLGAEKNAAGFLWAAFAVGSTVGALALVRLQSRWPAERIVLGGLAVFGTLMLLWPLAGTLAAGMALVALAGVADGPALAATFAVRQLYTPRSLHGQVFTTGASLKIGSFAVGSALAGPVVVGLGPEGAILVCAILQFVAVGAGSALLRFPRARVAV